MTRILHIIDELSGGGAAREMLNVSNILNEDHGYLHKYIALKPTGEHGNKLAKKAGIDIIENASGDRIYSEMEQADIVQIEWWNCSRITPLLLQRFPACRLVIRYHVAGDVAPHIITPNHLKLADINILSKANNPVLDGFDADWKAARVRCILHGADFSRMPNILPRPHTDFNVGYIGTVNFVKMHPDYIAMSNRISIPNVRFVVCGSIGEPSLLEDVKRLNAGHKFNFMGYQERLDDVIAEMDVFGYPLCPDTYASTELVLQEVMLAGVPPVVFPYGGVTQTVHHNQNGYVVRNADEYVQAIEYLYRRPKERKRLGASARRFVRKHLGVENTVVQYQDVYEHLMFCDKKPHLWGLDYHVNSSDHDKLVTSSVARNQTLSAAEMLFESLGSSAGRVFRMSFEHSDLDAVLRAEINIKQSRYLLSKSGVIPFRNLFPEDPYLNFWAGLCCEGLNDFNGAVVCYSAAINKGFSAWRVYWYLSRVLSQIGEHTKAAHLLDQVRRVVPDLDRIIAHYSSVASTETIKAVSVV